MKYTINLLSFATLSLIWYLVGLFINSITIVNKSVEYTAFGRWFWLVVAVLILISVFTNIQTFYEKLLSKYAKR